MFNRRILAEVLASFITLALIFASHQANEAIATATSPNLSNTLAAAPLWERELLNQKLQQLLDNQVAQGAPGVTMYIRRADGWTWSGASGRVGLGVFDEPTLCVRAWGHSGGWHGYYSQMYFLPDRNLAGAAMVNGNNIAPSKFLQEALNVLNGH